MIKCCRLIAQKLLIYVINTGILSGSFMLINQGIAGFELTLWIKQWLIAFAIIFVLGETVAKMVNAWFYRS